ncbi:phosphatase PAP2 family protein [Knoellia subterranea]|uniref:Acid phosphatase n=1 Tax=Knoellia subterranea KCTC 19937 TaxID=1385521 RepID=A0A0A0JR86_9MICO|nr:phosphatase PAP2 family protein [Knoellia subterranea]KGN39249.1 acid phosphatase [Knoellia subterranea KCTC 19937]
MPSADFQRPAPREDERIGTRDLAEWRTAAGRFVAGWLVRVAEVLGRLFRWAAANVGLVLTAVVGLVVIGVLTTVSGEVYEDVVDQDGIAALDQPVLDAAVRLRTPDSARWATDFTDLGGTVGMPVIAVVAAVGLALAWRRWMPVVLMAIAAAGSLLLTVTGKDLTGRARPPQSLAVPPYESSASFPSGHTLNATVVLGLTAYLLVIWLPRKRWRTVVIGALGTFIVAMGLSRVFLGHHWLTDVVAGWAIGLGWLATVITGHRVMLTLDRRHPPDPQDA